MQEYLKFKDLSFHPIHLYLVFIGDHLIFGLKLVSFKLNFFMKSRNFLI